MSIFAILNVGTSGMHANSFGTSVSAHNSSNVATEGFSRRHSIIENNPLPFGGGVRNKGSRRVIDTFVERRLLGAKGQHAAASAKSGALGVLDAILSESQGNLGDALDQFQNSIADVAAHPAEPAARQVMLERATQLSMAFNRANKELNQTRSDINEKIRLEVESVNASLEIIANLNREISKAEVTAQEASDLRDQRDLEIRKLSESLPVSYLEEANGQVTVLLQGTSTLVTKDGRTMPLIASENATTGDMDVYRQAAVREEIGSKLEGGRIGGYIAAREKGVLPLLNQLDQLAFDLATEYNNVHFQGTTLTGGAPPALFGGVTQVAGASGSIALEASMVGHPELIAAADTLGIGTPPGDNRGALRLQAVGRTALPEHALGALGLPATGSTYTAQQRIAAIVGDGAAIVNSSLAEEENLAQAESQIEALRDQVSGVSVDEEMVNLERFQRAYQASVKVIQVADEMLQDLMNLRS